MMFYQQLFPSPFYTVHLEYLQQKLLNNLNSVGKAYICYTLSQEFWYLLVDEGTKTKSH